MNKLIVDALDLLVTTDKGLEEVVDSLLRDAEIRGPEAEKLRAETLATLRGVRTQVVERAGDAVGRLTTAALERLRVPRQDEVRRLSEAVEALRAEVARLREQVERLSAEREAGRQGA